MWVLIVSIMWSSFGQITGQTVTQEFSSEKTCEAAIVEIEKTCSIGTGIKDRTYCFVLSKKCMPK